MGYTLHTHVVILHESANDNFSLVFECQAEDQGHAIEQAKDSYPNCGIVACERLQSSDNSHLRAGSTVWWKDPDNGLSSGRYQVTKIVTESGKVESDDTIVCISNDAGSHAEVHANELCDVPSIPDLADNLLNSESSEGCDDGYTVVHASVLFNLISEIKIADDAHVFSKANALAPTQSALSQAMQEHETLAKRIQKASAFMAELHDSVETLTGIAEEYGPRTLADLMYLQSAIIKDGFIDVNEDSSILDVIERLPSSKLWLAFTRTN